MGLIYTGRRICHHGSVPGVVGPVDCVGLTSSFLSAKYVLTKYIIQNEGDKKKMKLSSFQSVITSKIHCQNLNETLCSSRLGENSSTSGVIKLGWLWGRSLTKLAAVQKIMGPQGLLSTHAGYLQIKRQLTVSLFDAIRLHETVHYKESVGKSVVWAN